MTLDSTTALRNPTRPGTLSLPTKKAPPAAKAIKIGKPLQPERFIVESKADVSVDLAPEHRKAPPRIKAALNELAKSLIELTCDVPIEPRDTRALRLALAVIELAPECSPAFITTALKAFAENAPEAERIAAEELHKAVTSMALNARLARFRAMVESAIEIMEQRRVEGAGGQ